MLAEWLLWDEVCRLQQPGSQRPRAGEAHEPRPSPELDSALHNFHLSLLFCKMGILVPTPIAIVGADGTGGSETALTAGPAYTGCR